MRSETPANQAPDLYDPKSDEFNYFREDLGRSEISSKTKARLAERAARVTYVDPMDKPAADGTPFINIYDPDEVFADGKPFVGADDPDVYYKSSENNFLEQFADGCQTLALLTSLTLGAPSSNAKDGQGYDSMNAMGSMGSMGSMGTPVMPTPTMDSSVMPGSPSMGSMGGSKDAAPAKDQKVEPSAHDDSKLIFPEAAENPFKAPGALGETDFDLFKADREFAPKAPEPQKGSGYMMGGSMGGPGSMPPTPDK